MRHALLFSLALLLAACRPPVASHGDSLSENQPPKASTDATQTDWPAQFRAVHGGVFDPASAVDRAKMAALTGSATVKDSLTVPVVKESLTTQPSSTLPTRERVLAVARGLVGQRETHGANRSPWIDAANRLTGAPLGSPYCASYNAWCYSEGKAPAGWPRSAWSPDWVKAPTWTAAKGGKTPRPGDAFGVWFTNKGRVAHTGLVEIWDVSTAVTLEGNTSPSAEFGSSSDRDGDGVWRKRRLVRQMHSARNWLD